MPGLSSNLKTLLIRGFLRSSPIKRTLLPSIAVMAARLIEMKVLPSELIVDETAITGFSFSLIKYFSDVRIALKDSASDDPGFSTTGISLFPSLWLMKPITGTFVFISTSRLSITLLLKKSIKEINTIGNTNPRMIEMTLFLLCLGLTRLEFNVEA